MKTLYTNKLQQRLYTPLTYNESLPYIGCYYQRPHTAFNVDVIQIVAIMNDGTVEYKEQELKTINITPERILQDGGRTFPTKSLMVNKSLDKIKKGRLVYSNISKRIVLWIDKYVPYEMTYSNQIYTVMLDGWSPYTATNFGKYGT